MVAALLYGFFLFITHQKESLSFLDLFFKTIQIFYNANSGDMGEGEEKGCEGGKDCLLVCFFRI